MEVYQVPIISVPLAIQSSKTGDGSRSFLSLLWRPSLLVISRAACFVLWPGGQLAAHRPTSHKKIHRTKIHPRNFLRVFFRFLGRLLWSRGLCGLTATGPPQKRRRSLPPLNTSHPLPLWNHSEPAHRTTGEIRVHWREGVHSGERASKGWPDTR